MTGFCFRFIQFQSQLLTTPLSSNMRLGMVLDLRAVGWFKRSCEAYAAGAIDTADVTLRWGFTLGITVARTFALFSCRAINELMDLA